MGLIKFLDKAFASYQEHLPEMMEFAEKFEENAEKRQREREKKQQTNQKIIEEYKDEMCALSDKELVDVIQSSENRLEKKASLELLQERGYVRDDDNVWRKHL